MSDLGSSNWSETAASNNATPPNGWPEGMNPSDVNNSARENMAAEKRWYNRSNPIKTTGGTSTVYTLTYDVAAAQYYDGELVAFVVHTSCGAAPTLNINSLGAVNLRKWVGSFANLASGDLAANQVVVARYNSGAPAFDIISGQATIPTGSVHDHAGSTAPDGYLLCDGSAVNRTTYAALFAVISTTYGAGDGSTTFNVPDLRDRAIVGKGNMGGSAANRITNGVSGIDTTVLGATGGVQSNTAITTSSGSNTISVTSTSMDTPSTITSSQPGVGQNHGGPDHTHANVHSSGTNTISVSGTSGAFSVVQPIIVMNKIIKT